MTDEQLQELAPEIEPLVLAVLEKRVKEAKAAARIPLEHAYEAGQSRKIASPLDGLPLGTVGREFPTPSWQVTDQAALNAALGDDPDNVEYVDELAVTGPALVEALRELAPGLLARVERVKASAVRAALAAASTGETPLPGISRVAGRSALYVRPDKNAVVAIERLVAAGLIRIDGRPVELPAARTEAAS